jgi:hypothetical protein
MSDEEEIVVTIDDEKPLADTAAQTKEQQDDAAKIQDPAVKDLAAQYKELEAENNQRAEREAAANRRAEEAHRAAQEAIREAEAAKAQARSSNADTINTALASATAEVEAAKRDIKLAGEAGDYEALADAQERLAAAKSLALRYDEAKADLEAAKQEQPKRREAPQERVPADPVESYIAGRSAPTAQWLRSHTDYITDPRKNAKMNAAHHDAVAEGFAPDTPQYFEHVEKFLGLKQADNQQLRKRPASRPVAPTATANGSSSSNASNEVRLTAGEARSATDGTIVWNYDDPSGQKRFRKGDPIGVQEMARRKKAMKSQGAYDRSYEVQ